MNMLDNRRQGVAVVSAVALQQEGYRLDPTNWQRGLSAGSLASSHSSKTCRLGDFQLPEHVGMNVSVNGCLSLL